MANIVITRNKTLPESSAKADFHELVETASATVSNIVNADCDANMALQDSKLAQITTASKVSGAAVTLLTSVPSGAGRLPRENTPLINTDTVVALNDADGEVINASLGNIFTMTATNNRTLGTTTNATNGQKLIIRFTASSGARTLTLPTATTGDFAFGSDITAITQTASGKTDYIGCIYSSVANRWHVVAFVKGF